MLQTILAVRESVKARSCGGGPDIAVPWRPESPGVVVDSVYDTGNPWRTPGGGRLQQGGRGGGRA